MPNMFGGDQFDPDYRPTSKDSGKGRPVIEADYSDRIALFDMDGTIADYEGKLIKDLARLGPEPLPNDLHGHVPYWVRNRMNLIKSREGWWRSIPRINSGLSLISLCTEIGFKVHVLTQGPLKTHNAWGEKLAWCEDHVKLRAPDYGISITRKGKGLHYGRVFVDDWPPFMLEWLRHRPRGLGLMPETNSNKDFTHSQVIKYDPKDDFNRQSYPELWKRLNEAYNRGREQ